ncbi:DUF4262 domain-containing protein [Micromonospora eburnea]|uniref:DUF4262 domain-containing protein n=1 Tax=Micromonospora eburnea TaxID=227316 RepID=A0A1C6V449_9ACTN|nr:DUF4262 domain-containing protein [Micromonospora eburnea]SCL61123.1 protein of unknown function [Micromonospora eburnea]
MVIEDCVCLICSGSAPGRDGATVARVRKSGWSVLWVAGGLDFAYTIGLWHTFRRPEVAMFGLEGQGMQLWLNEYVDHGREHGWPGENEPFHGVIEDFPTQLRPVHDSWHDALFGTAYRFYRGAAVPFQQLVWPDREGRWPWAEGATASSRNRQAFSWLPVQEHPAGGWRLVGELEPGFPFPVGPDSWALTTRGLAAGARPIARVVLEEGCYDVLDERGYRADDLCLAFLGELVRRHPHLVGCADLADGQVAVSGEGQNWSRSSLSRPDRRNSARSWKRARPI